MKYLITGISGTLGQAVSKILLDKKDTQIIGYSRDEQKQRLLPKNPKVTLYLGDVRDRDRITEASRGVDILFHFAALKCVDTLEDNPDEAKKTNVDGTENVLHAQRVNGIKRVVLSSTDKAVYPVNAYGTSKMLSEYLVRRNQNNVVVRYGNVLASRGSVVGEFVRTIRNDKTVKITHSEMTRFFLTQEEAAQFVVASAFAGQGGLYIPDIKCTSIVTLARTIGKILNTKVIPQNVGIRPGEKLHECLRTLEEGGPIYSNTGTKFTETELLDKLTPIVASFA